MTKRHFSYVQGRNLIPALKLPPFPLSSLTDNAVTPYPSSGVRVSIAGVACHAEVVARQPGNDSPPNVGRFGLEKLDK
jgi:hypothetical protein